MTAPRVTAIQPVYTPQARAERLIAAGRFILAFASLTAVFLEPSTPAQYQRATYTLLVVYTLYALVTTAVAWRSPVPSARWRLVSHALDLVLFSVFVYFTEGPASPFFLYFVFSLFCATLRFSWRGILGTGVAAMAIYGVMAMLASVGDPAFEASRAVIRVAYLAVITALLVYLGIYQQQLRTELAVARRLAARAHGTHRRRPPRHAGACGVCRPRAARAAGLGGQRGAVDVRRDVLRRGLPHRSRGAGDVRRSRCRAVLQHYGLDA